MRLPKDSPMTVFIDMDGVLCEYTPSDYTGDEPAFMVPNTNYFARRPQMDNVVKAARVLSDTLSDEYDMAVLTTLVPDDEGKIYAEHMTDKRMWLCKQGIFCPMYAAIQGSITKVQIVEMALSRALTPTDILIDDYRRNLNDWAEHGGTAVLMRNNLNRNKPYDGPTLDSALSGKDILRDLFKVINAL